MLHLDTHPILLGRCSHLKQGQAEANCLIAHLRTLCATFGVPFTLSSDGGPEFTASATQDFLERWGIRHRISSAHFPQSNGRAEVAVKKVKCFLLACIGPSGSLNTNIFLQGMLHPDCILSPAQIIFSRLIRTRFAKSVETLNAHAHQLPKLALGFVQNQTDPHPNKWDHSGTIAECMENEQYVAKLDGTGRLTLRNRRFFRQYTLPLSSYYTT